MFRQVDTHRRHIYRHLYILQGPSGFCEVGERPPQWVIVPSGHNRRDQQSGVFIISSEMCQSDKTVQEQVKDTLDRDNK